MDSTNINVTDIISRAFISVNQTVMKGTNNTQIVSIDCSDTVISNICNSCTKITSDLFTDPFKNVKEIQNACNFACACNITNVNMSQLIQLNMKNRMTSENENNFKTQFMNELYYQAEQSDIGVFNLDSNIENITTILTTIYTKMSASTFQLSIESINTLQTIQFKGPGFITNLDMTMVVKYISNVIQKSIVLQKDIQDLTALISKITTQIVEAGLSQIILIILQILMVIVISVAGFFCVQMTMTLITSI
jgi:hypothetical protein